MEVVKKVNAIKARKNLGILLEEVYYKGDQYVIERAGRAMAAVVPVWQLEERKHREKRFFDAIDKVQEKNKRARAELIEREVKERYELFVDALADRKHDPVLDANVRPHDLSGGIGRLNEIRMSQK